MKVFQSKYFGMSHYWIEEWERIYAPLDVMRELEKMVQWLDANPKRHKKNYYRFVINWLNSAHAKAISARFERYSPKSEVVYRDQDGQRYVVTAEHSRRYL